ncbi:ABC transporter permease [Nocardia niigatensis]|uniref:ABC transporter permease n=1 Tax=Nocardia niigatensis TaxID=209249 RepID=UPI0002FE5D74|nr:ABC transporter permease [Nocardia niigatensis]
MGVLAAERIKLTSTKSPVWCTALLVVFALGIAALFSLALNASWRVFEDQLAQGKMTPADAPYAENSVAGLGITGLAQGIPGFGYLMVMILAALAVTSEYRFGTIKTTFLSIPNRSTVLLTKAGVIGVAMALLSAVLTFVGFFIFKVMVNHDAGSHLSLSSGDLRVFYAVPLFILLVVFLAVGVGTLIRQSAGALSLLIVWPVILEPMVGAFGKIGREIQVLLPFQNAGLFLGTVDAKSSYWHWGPWGGLIYFAIFVALIFAAALFVVNKRDA